MRRLLLLGLVPLLIGVGIAARTSAEAPLCALSADFERELLSVDAALGAAVYDLRTGTIWSGGQAGPYVLHSAVKAPIAWAVLSDAQDSERELTKSQRDALFGMVALSRNGEVERLLKLIGGLSGLNGFYTRWGVPELAESADPVRWGRGRAESVQLARLYAALAVSDEVPDQARAEGFELLRAVVEEQRWGARISERLDGWESLIKTGNYTVESSAADDSDDPDEPDDPLVRMNSAAIWLESAAGGAPRYVIAIMQESRLSWSDSRRLQDRIGGVIAEAIARRESGEWALPAGHCVKRALA